MDGLSRPTANPGRSGTVRIAVGVLAAFLGLCASGCETVILGTAELPAVYDWTDCYPIDNDLAGQLGFYVDYCADPKWGDRHWGVVAYYAGSSRRDYLAMAWGIWYGPRRSPDLSRLRVLIRLDDGRSFLGASGARPQFTCRADDRGDCVGVAVKLRGADGTTTERVFLGQPPARASTTR